MFSPQFIFKIEDYKENKDLCDDNIKKCYDNGYKKICIMYNTDKYYKLNINKSITIKYIIKKLNNIDNLELDLKFMFNKFEYDYISKMNKLTGLCINCSNDFNINDILKISNLKKLYIFTNGNVKLVNDTYNYNINELYVKTNNINSINILINKCPNIKKLSLICNNMKYIPYINHLKKLEKLYVYGENIIKIDALDKCKYVNNIKKLILYTSEYTDIKPLLNYDINIIRTYDNIMKKILEYY